MKSIFAELNTGYDLRHGNDSLLPKVHTTTNGIETISFLGNRLWLILLKEVRGIPMILNVKKLVAEMTANETVKLSNIIDIDKDKFNMLSKGKSKYRADPILDKGMDVQTGDTGGTYPSLFHKFVYKVPLFSFQCALSCLRGFP